MTEQEIKKQIAHILRQRSEKEWDLFMKPNYYNYMADAVIEVMKLANLTLTVDSTDPEFRIVLD
jgi:hypothetical protein